MSERKTKIRFLEGAKWVGPLAIDGSDSSGEDEDELAKLQKEGLKRKALRVKDLEMDKIMLEAEKDVEKLRGGEPPTMQNPSSNVANPGSSLLMMLIAQGLEPAKANEYIKALDNESIMKLSMVGAQNRDALLPLLLLGSKQGTSVKDIVDVVNAILSVARPAQAQGGDGMVTKLVTETLPDMYKAVAAKEAESYKLLASAKDVAYAAQLQLLQKQIEDMKPQNPLDYVKQVYEAAGALGLKQGSEVNVEVEKMRLDLEKWKHEQTTKKEETKQVLGTVQAIMDGKVGSIIETFGEAVITRRGSRGAEHSQEANPVRMVQCGKCSGTFRVVGNVKAIKCPHCGVDLTIGSQPPTQQVETPQQKETPEAQPPESEGSEPAPA